MEQNRNYEKMKNCESAVMVERELMKTYSALCEKGDGNVRASIAMAVYNGEKYVAQQIDSILQMMNQNDELIVSYDKSVDNTLAIIKRYE